MRQAQKDAQSGRAAMLAIANAAENQMEQLRSLASGRPPKK
jgi:hypothetical protein